MKKKITTLFTLLIIALCTSVAYGQTHWFSFDGTVAGVRVNGSMTLYGNGSVDGVYGYNKYTKNNSNAYLDLRGTWRKTGRYTYQLTLTEYSNGQVCGSWNVSFNDDNGRLKGTMRNRKGKTYKVNCNSYWD